MSVSGPPLHGNAMGTQRTGKGWGSEGSFVQDLVSRGLKEPLRTYGIYTWEEGRRQRRKGAAIGKRSPLSERN